MEHEAPQHFDVLILDAFSGDAIPTHLLTREALQVYLRHLAPHGVIAAHISNRHLDLSPVMQGLADSANMKLARIDSLVTQDAEEVRSIWTLFSHNDKFLAQPAIRTAMVEPAFARSLLWTDDYSNLFEVMQWRTRQ
jgi:spermidine synthase